MINDYQRPSTIVPLTPWVGCPIIVDMTHQVIYRVKGETQERHSDHSTLALAEKKAAKLGRDIRVEYAHVRSAQ